jgi:hypothetical protein
MPVGKPPIKNAQPSRFRLGDLPFRWYGYAIWRSGSVESHSGPVHVSMNDYLIHRLRDVPRVAREGLWIRRHWPDTEGAIGLWVATFRGARRQVSVSVWRSREDLRRFVGSPMHLRIMREFRDAGALYTNAWTAERLDRALIWRQATDRLKGRVEGVPHH